MFISLSIDDKGIAMQLITNCMGRSYSCDTGSRCVLPKDIDRIEVCVPASYYKFMNDYSVKMSKCNKTNHNWFVNFSLKCTKIKNISLILTTDHWFPPGTTKNVCCITLLNGSKQHNSSKDLLLVSELQKATPGEILA